MTRRGLSVGTRSVLFGAHQFAIHPWFVAAAWWRLYGFPWDPRLWVAFFVHDLGYVGKPDIDGAEGETHPELGARIMGRLFGAGWGDFCLLHSRFYARRRGRPYSRLCAADKLATAMTWLWLYLPMVRLTAELAEYRAGRATPSKGWTDRDGETDWEWARRVQDYCRRWAFEHRDGREDTWTAATAPSSAPEVP